jgi:Protein of unknown function (DUF3617)
MKIALSAVVAALFLPGAAQAMDPGEWEFRTTVSSPMMQVPQVATAVQCVTPEDARDPTRYAARNEAPGCTVKPGARTADSYEWTVACDGQGMRGGGRARFSGKELESSMRLNVDSPGLKMEISSETKGRYMGPCKAK